MTAADKARLLRVACGATDARNADRLAKLFEKRGVWLAELSPMGAERIATQLPAVIRAEADTARATASDTPGIRDRAQLMKRGEVLDTWALECLDVKRQQAALRVLHRRELRALNRESHDDVTEGDTA